MALPTPRRSPQREAREVINGRSRQALSPPGFRSVPRESSPAPQQLPEQAISRFRSKTPPAPALHRLSRLPSRSRHLPLLPPQCPREWSTPLTPNSLPPPEEPVDTNGPCFLPEHSLPALLSIQPERSPAHRRPPARAVSRSRSRTRLTPPRPSPSALRLTPQVPPLLRHLSPPG